MSSPAVESYLNNVPLRASYFSANGITHVEAWDGCGGYVPALGFGEGRGWPEIDRVFATVAEVEAWAAKFCPELPFRN